MPLISGIVAAVGAISTFIGGIGGVGGFLLRTAAGLGLSYAAQALAGKPKDQRQSQAFRVNGQIRADGVVPRSYMSGPGMTAGSLVYANTWGTSTSVPNALCIQVIALQDIPSKGLRRVMVNGEWVTITEDEHADGRGFAVLEYRKDGQDHLWIREYDGTQTVADPFLVAKFGTHPKFPYESTRVGRGVAYVICTARVNEKLFTGFPEYKFEVEGTKWYDPSKDTTAGGDGSQRWDTPSTWGGDGDELPIVQLYNLCRGISYGGDWLYGLQGVSSAQLPNAAWIAAIEKCRAEVDGPDGSEPQYRCGGEVQVSGRIADTVEALLTSCNGKLAEIGGFYKPRAGSAGSIVGYFSDADIITTEGQSFTPFKSLADTINAIAAKYPEPEEGYNVKAAPTRYDAGFEAADGNRRLLADVDYSMVSHKGQVQRLQKSALDEARRDRDHTVTLPPSFWKFEPLDVLGFSSQRNGYVEKAFELVGATDKANLDNIFVLNEVDPADYDWDQESDYVPPVDGSIGVQRPDPQPMTGWQVFPDYIQDASETKQRPSIRVEFASGLEDVRAVRVQARNEANEQIVFDGEIPYQDLEEVSEGVFAVILNAVFLSDTDYEVRGKYIPISDRDTEWSEWLEVTTPSVADVELGTEIEAKLRFIDELPGRLRLFANKLDNLAGAFNTSQALTEEYRGQQSVSIASRFAENFAASEIALQAITDEMNAYAEILAGVTAETSAGTTEGLMRFTALSSEEVGLLLRFAIEMRGSVNGTDWKHTGFEIVLLETPTGLKSAIRMKASQITLEVDEATIPASGLYNGRDVKDAPVEDGKIYIDLTGQHKTHTTLLDDDAEIQFPVGAWVGAEWNHIITQASPGGFELAFDYTTYIVGDDIPQPATSTDVISIFRGLVTSLNPPKASFDFIRSGATTSASEKQFSISPALPTGETTWNLDVDGELIIDGATDSDLEYTITPLGNRLDCDVVIWGPGGSSGAVGQGYVPDFPGVGTATTFEGGVIALLTAGAGVRSSSIRKFQPAIATVSNGGAAGVASGTGATLQNGSQGGSNRPSGTGNANYAGAGAAAPDGGAAIPGVYSVPSGGSSIIRHGVNGNSPGGGARGAAAASTAANLAGYSAGAGSGAKVTRTYNVSYPLLKDVPYTVTLGHPGAQATATGSNPAQGGIGGKSRIRISA
jgi:hypothetical protein